MQKVAPRNKEETVPGLLVTSAWERTFGHRGLRQQRKAQGSKAEREVGGVSQYVGPGPSLEEGPGSGQKPTRKVQVLGLAWHSSAQAQHNSLI